MKIPYSSWCIVLFLSILSNIAFAQEIKVSGTITAENGEAIIGAFISVKSDKSVGTTSDLDGFYELRVPSAKDTLIFSYIGFSSEEIPVNGQNVIDMMMSESKEFLDEVVVIGYGTQRKSDLTGAVSTVKASDLTRIPTPSLAQALQGKVAGVQVTPVSGEPGAEAIIRIRGTGTLGDASPLFVVDGMLLSDIGFLNPLDVESVEILKDASSTAIYGSRGANGVIIVTTKKGTINKDATFEFSSYAGQQSLVRKISLTNAHDFAILANEVAEYENIGLPFSDPEIFGEGTDWQDEIYQNAPMMSYQLSVNGGTEKTLYNISGNFFKQKGIIEGSEYQRFTLRINNQYKLKPWASLGHNLTLMNIKRDIAAGVVGSAYRADPTVPAIDSLGNFGNTSVRASIANPAAQIFYNNNSGSGIRAVGNMFLDIHFLKDFTFRTNFGIDVENNQSKSFTPVFFVSAIQQNTENSLFFASEKIHSWLWDNTLTFEKEWADHRVNVLAGMSAQEYVFENFGGSRKGLPGESEELWFLSAGEIEGQSNYHSGFEWALLSYLFRTNYTFKERYLLTVSFRADGSSKFGTNNRFGYFPSFAVGWNLTNEPFMKDVDYLSRLKLRLSWGVIGNEKIGAYAGRPVVTSNLNAVFGTTEQLNFGASVITLANPDIRWEESKQTDFGIEMGFFENKFTAEIDYFNRVTDGILVNVPIPSFVGSANFPVVNAAKVKNSGFDFDVNWKELRGKVFYHLGLVASLVNNEVLELGEGNEEIFGGGLGVGGQLGTRTVVGLPIGAFYGFVTNGIFQNEEEIMAGPTLGGEVPGDLRFVDMNSDGIITSDDRTYLGSPIPDFIYGFNLGAEAFGVDFSIEFNGVKGNKIINAKKMARFGTYNFETSALDRWTGEGTSSTEPSVSNGGHNFNVSDHFIEDGSFLRLRNIQIGYSFPNGILEKIHIQKFRIYLSGTNLATRTNYTGYTPEIASGSVIDVGIDRGVYPISKTFLGGIQITF